MHFGKCWTEHTSSRRTYPGKLRLSTGLYPFELLLEFTLQRVSALQSTLKRELQRGRSTVSSIPVSTLYFYLSLLEMVIVLKAHPHKAQDLHLSIHQVQDNSFATDTPTAFHNKAQGRGAHPGYWVIKHAYPNGVLQWAMGYCGTPLAYEFFDQTNPACAPRRWALL